MSFVEVQFSPSISLGATGGAMFSTDIIETYSGWEQRNINWSESRGRWNVATGIKTNADMDNFIAFFRSRKGRAVGFRFKDWTDYQVINGDIATGDGSISNFQLRKQYISGNTTVNRPITKPVEGSYSIFIDGIEQVEAVDYTLDATTGIITFNTAPANNEVITASFEFDIPVRFDTDMMDITANTNALKSWGNIPVIELRV